MYSLALFWARNGLWVALYRTWRRFSARGGLSDPVSYHWLRGALVRKAKKKSPSSRTDLVDNPTWGKITTFQEIPPTHSRFLLFLSTSSITTKGKNYKWCLRWTFTVIANNTVIWSFFLFCFEPLWLQFASGHDDMFMIFRKHISHTYTVRHSKRFSFIYYYYHSLQRRYLPFRSNIPGFWNYVTITPRVFPQWA